MLYAPPPNSFQSGVLPHEAAVVIQLSVQVYALGPSRKQAIVSQRYHIAGLL